MRNVTLAIAATTMALPVAVAVPVAPTSSYSAAEAAAQRDYRGRTWRGRDGRTYCRKSNGTTGLLVGGAAGALAGRAIDGGRDKTTGTILGAAAGALLGRHVDRSTGRDRYCR